MCKVSVIILNYNTFSLTCDCINSLINFTGGISYEIILVDNASTECDPVIFLDKFPGLKLIRSAKNVGFAKGNNLGIEQASGDYILLLNSDTFLKEDSISKAVQCLKMHKEVGVIGCRMIYPDGTIQYTARKFRSISWELLDLFRFILYLLPYKKRSRLMLGKYFRHDEPVFCDWLNGAFFLFPKKIVSELPNGKLDDRFFMYGEDQLWCEHFSNLGYKNMFYPGTTIIHINSGSTDLSRQLKLRKTMLKHELEIMRLRKGEYLYYHLFRFLYGSKETIRNFLKSVYFRFSGKLLK
jgi:GT2 family glycosyltransferase